jgi:hypothetical protein
MYVRSYPLLALNYVVSILFQSVDLILFFCGTEGCAAVVLKEMKKKKTNLKNMSRLIRLPYIPSLDTTIQRLIAIFHVLYLYSVKGAF